MQYGIFIALLLESPSQWTKRKKFLFCGEDTRKLWEKKGEDPLPQPPKKGVLYKTARWCLAENNIHHMLQKNSQQKNKKGSDIWIDVTHTNTGL